MKKIVIETFDEIAKKREVNTNLAIEEIEWRHWQISKLSEHINKTPLLGYFGDHAETFSQIFLWAKHSIKYTNGKWKY